MKQITLETGNRTAFLDISQLVQHQLSEMGVTDGVVTVFVPHTTAGITINENADPDVMTDIEGLMDELVPWTGAYLHAEGNTAAHMKSIMTGTSVQVIVRDGSLQLGTWQGIYFCEYDGPRTRKVWIAASA